MGDLRGEVGAYVRAVELSLGGSEGVSRRKSWFRGQQGFWKGPSDERKS